MSTFHKYLKFKKKRNSDLTESFLSINREINKLDPKDKNYLSTLQEKRNELNELDCEIRRRGGKIVGNCMVLFGDKVRKKFIKL